MCVFLGQFIKEEGRPHTPRRAYACARGVDVCMTETLPEDETATPPLPNPDPPSNTPQAEPLPPLQQYLRHLFLERLACPGSADVVLRLCRRLPWSDSQARVEAGVIR